MWEYNGNVFKGCTTQVPVPVDKMIYESESTCDKFKKEHSKVLENRDIDIIAIQVGKRTTTCFPARFNKSASWCGTRQHYIDGPEIQLINSPQYIGICDVTDGGYSRADSKEVPNNHHHNIFQLLALGKTAPSPLRKTRGIRLTDWRMLVLCQMNTARKCGTGKLTEDR